MEKAYNRINWENYPSDQTPINESNLNRLDLAADILDDRTIILETTKLDKAIANGMVKDVFFNPANGIFSITYLSGSTVIFDTKLEKLAVNFSYDAAKQCLVITLDDGTEQNVDLSSLITEYEFTDTDTIIFEIVNGRVQAKVRAGSITGDMLEPDYLSEIQIEAGRAQGAAREAVSSAAAAAASEQAAKESEEIAAEKAAAAIENAAGAQASEQAAAAAEAAATKSAAEAAASETKAKASRQGAEESEAAAAEKAGAAAEKASTAQNAAEIAEQNARTAVDKSILAESFARGGTGTRAGEDTDNAYFYMQEAKAQSGGIPTKLSELTNDMDFVTSMTQALAYYYKSSQLYTREEIDGMLSAIPKFSLAAVEALPTENISDTTIYLLKEREAGTDTCSEWVYINGSWERLGDMQVDLSGYLTRTGDGSSLTNTFGTAPALENIVSGEKQSTIFGKISKAIATVISHVSATATASALGHVKVDSAMSFSSTNPVQNKVVNTALAAKLSAAGDAGNTTVTYTEAAALTELASGEKQSVAFGKLKLAVKNVISIVKLLGKADICNIGDGTVTGAIIALNSHAGKIKVVQSTTPSSISGVVTINIPYPEGFDYSSQMIGVRIDKYVYLPYAAGSYLNINFRADSMEAAFLPGAPDYLLNKQIYITLLQCI